jgi:aspartate aminotransferase
MIPKQKGTLIHKVTRSATDRYLSAMTIIAPASHGLTFGDPDDVGGGLSALARGLKGSEILRIAADVRALIAEGRPVCNLTVGDFDPKQFPIPQGLRTGIQRALDAGETNYPPSDGLPGLRAAVVEYIAREHDVRYPPEGVMITSGGRPAIYAAFRCILSPGDTVVYPVPSWNNDYYAMMVGAREAAVPARREAGFMPTVDDLAPYLGEATLLSLCSPNNPTGTLLSPDVLRDIMEAVVEENGHRQAAGRRPLYVLYDLMYGALVFGGAAHAHPLAVAPEAAPWVVTLDGVSKAFAATGLRVGWATGNPVVIARMKDLLGHVGAWAPRPEQVATAALLHDVAGIAAYRTEMHCGLMARLDALYSGFSRLRDEGYPVDCVRPQGAMYLSLQLDLIGRSVGGVRIGSNESLRTLMLQRAGLAVVPFQAFGLRADTGWSRLSAGAVSVREIEECLPRVKAVLDTVSSDQ